MIRYQIGTKLERGKKTVLLTLSINLLYARVLLLLCNHSLQAWVSLAHLCPFYLICEPSLSRWPPILLSFVLRHYMCSMCMPQWHHRAAQDSPPKVTFDILHAPNLRTMRHLATFGFVEDLHEKR